jgi:hypothetical protein
VNLEQNFDGNRVAFTDGLRTKSHGVDVTEYLDRRHIRWAFAKLACGIRAEQSARANFEAFDARRRHRLGAQDQARECLGVDKRARAQIELRDRAFCIRDISGDIPVEHDRATG